MVWADEGLSIDLEPLIGFVYFQLPYHAQNEVAELLELHVGTHRLGADDLDGSVVIVHINDDGREPEYQPEVIAYSAVNLASWAGRMETHRPVELFTVNYDLLIEAGLEELGVPYFDGFVGVVNGRFAPELIEPTDAREETRLPAGFVRLWKLHGSTNWTSRPIGGRTQIVRTALAQATPSPSTHRTRSTRSHVGSRSWLSWTGSDAR